MPGSSLAGVIGVCVKEILQITSDCFAADHLHSDSSFLKKNGLRLVANYIYVLNLTETEIQPQIIDLGLYEDHLQLMRECIQCIKNNQATAQRLIGNRTKSLSNIINTINDATDDANKKSETVKSVISKLMRIMHDPEDIVQIGLCGATVNLEIINDYKGTEDMNMKLVHDFIEKQYNESHGYVSLLHVLLDTDGYRAQSRYSYGASNEEELFFCEFIEIMRLLACFMTVNGIAQALSRYIVKCIDKSDKANDNNIRIQRKAAIDGPQQAHRSIQLIYGAIASAVSEILQQMKCMACPEQAKFFETIITQLYRLSGKSFSGLAMLGAGLMKVQTGQYLSVWKAHDDILAPGIANFYSIPDIIREVTKSKFYRSASQSVIIYLNALGIYMQDLDDTYIESKIGEISDQDIISEINKVFGQELKVFGQELQKAQKALTRYETAKLKSKTSDTNAIVEQEKSKVTELEQSIQRIEDQINAARTSRQEKKISAMKNARLVTQYGPLINLVDKGGLAELYDTLHKCFVEIKKSESVDAVCAKLRPLQELDRIVYNKQMVSICDNTTDEHDSESVYGSCIYVDSEDTSVTQSLSSIVDTIKEVVHSSNRLLQAKRATGQIDAAIIEHHQMQVFSHLKEFEKLPERFRRLVCSKLKQPKEISDTYWASITDPSRKWEQIPVSEGGYILHNRCEECVKALDKKALLDLSYQLDRSTSEVRDRIMTETLLATTTLSIITLSLGGLCVHKTTTLSNTAGFACALTATLVITLIVTACIVILGVSICARLYNYESNVQMQSLKLPNTMISSAATSDCTHQLQQLTYKLT